MMYDQSSSQSKAMVQQILLKDSFSIGQLSPYIMFTHKN